MYINSGEITTVMLSYFRSATRFILTPTPPPTAAVGCCTNGVGKAISFPLRVNAKRRRKRFNKLHRAVTTPLYQ